MENTALPTNLSSLGVKAHDVFDDFLWGGASNDGPVSIICATLNGGTAAHETSDPSDNSYIGRLDVNTGTTSNSNGKAVYHSSAGTNKIKAGGAPLTIEWRIRIPTLSGSPSFTTRIGLLDSNAVGSPSNGIYLYYTDSNNSGKWSGITRNASTSTVVNSNITVAANTWYKLRIQVNAAGTIVEFFVNDVSIGTSTTNISTTNAMRLMASIEKTSSTTTSRSMQLDYVYYRIER